MNHIPSPDTSDAGIERAIQAKGKTAPRVTPAAIQANIVSEHYFTAADGVTGEYLRRVGANSAPVKELETLTFCVLVLRNGFTVVGKSAPASPENFDPQIGRDIAKANAMNEIWPLMGYELKSRIHRGEVV